MAPHKRGSTHPITALLLIYRPRKGERLSWPSLLNCSRRFTQISGHPSAAGQAQDRKVRRRKIEVLPLCYATNQPCQRTNHSIYKLQSTIVVRSTTKFISIVKTNRGTYRIPVSRYFVLHSSSLRGIFTTVQHYAVCHDPG